MGYRGSPHSPVLEAIMIIFPITEVNALRHLAAEASHASDSGPDGWSKCDVDPMKLLAVFKTLRIKDGLILRAYQFREGGNGNGVIWAMPDNAPFPEPTDCPRMKGSFLEPPRPPKSLDRLMDAIQGDGAPWSYLSASLFSREAAEFGAMWHGCNWSTHHILGADPWQCEPKAKDRRKRQPLASSKPEQWTWIQPRPTIWEPQHERNADTISISFLTYSGHDREAIYQTTDSYQAGSYVFESKRTFVAEGLGGYIF